MFCTNCGTQLPDGAKFCTNCGNQMNVAPVMPVMPATPVIPEEPVVSEPVVVQSQPMMQPQQTMAQPSPEMPPAPKKKSKAPLFIGLGIGAIALVVIIVVSIMLIMGGLSKKDDSSNETTSSNTEKETSSEVSNGDDEEFSTTEAPTINADDTLTDDDIETDSQTMAEEIMTDVADYKVKAIDKYILPAVNDYLLSKDRTTTYLLDGLYECLIDSKDNLLSYQVSNIEVVDSTYFDEENIEYILQKETDSYVRPTDFSRATITVTYEDQSSVFYLHFCVCENEIYLYDFNTDDFALDFSDQSSGITVAISDEVRQMLDNNYKTLTAGTHSNTFKGIGYTVDLPDGWLADTKSAAYPYIIAPSKTTLYYVSVDSTYSLVTPEEFVQAVYNIHVNNGFSDIEVGNLVAEKFNGHYISFKQEAEGETWYTTQFLFEGSDGNCLCFTLQTKDTSSAEYATACESIASINIE